MAKVNTPPRVGENKMGTMPVGKLLVNMATPMIVAMLVQALYNVVDSYFVSRITEFGDCTDTVQVRESAIAAMSLAFAVQNILIGLATGIRVGVNALLSKSLGEGNQERANRSAGNGVLLVLVAAVISVTFGIFGSRPYFSMMSDVAMTVEMGSQYISICSICAIGIFIEILGERLLQASGRTGFTLLTQGTGAVLNIILDPLLIFGIGPFPKMGIVGAAVATVIGQWVAAILAVILNLKFNPDIQFSPRFLKPKKDAIVPILTVGIPSIIMTSIGSVANIGMNWVLKGFSQFGEVPINILGIYLKLQSFFFMPLFGMNNANISIVAYNYGARKPDRITKALKLVILSTVAFMLVGLGVFQAIPQVLLGIFDKTEPFVTLGSKALRTISFCFPVAAIGIALSASFQALGNGIYSSIVSLCRQLVVLLPAAYLLGLTGNLDAVWWAFPIAELMSLVITLFLFLRIYRQKIKPLQA